MLLKTTPISLPPCLPVLTNSVMFWYMTISVVCVSARTRACVYVCVCACARARVCVECVPVSACTSVCKYMNVYVGRSRVCACAYTCVVSFFRFFVCLFVLFLSLSVSLCLCLSVCLFIRFHFSLSTLVLLPSPVALTVLSFVSLMAQSPDFFSRHF